MTRDSEGGEVGRSGGYRRASAGWLRGPIPWRWRLRRVRRMDPAPVYYAVIGGAGTVLGVVGDLLGLLAWWVGTLTGVVAAWGFTWLTALDDLRHPIRSFQLVLADLRGPIGGAWVLWARLLDVQLWVPPVGWGGDLHASSRGKEYRGGLLTPPRYRFTVIWGDGEGRWLSLTVADDDSRGGQRHLPDGISRALVAVLSEEEEHPGIADLARRLRPTTITLNGAARPGRLLDLRVEGLGWIAQLDGLDGRRLVVRGGGLQPEEVELVSFSVDEALERWPTLGRRR